MLCRPDGSAGREKLGWKKAGLEKSWEKAGKKLEKSWAGKTGLEKRNFGGKKITTMTVQASALVTVARSRILKDQNRADRQTVYGGIGERTARGARDGTRICFYSF
eukprot:Hpha_TRINITY_DN16649_c0_g3::TRINITY_DN16649_c0_g3_i8::g.182792::m.182792